LLASEGQGQVAVKQQRASSQSEGQIIDSVLANTWWACSSSTKSAHIRDCTDNNAR
jgi:hypothetical protein